MHIYQLISDIITTINSKLDFISQYNLRLVSHFFIKYPITNFLDNVPNKKKLTDEKFEIISIYCEIKCL